MSPGKRWLLSKNCRNSCKSLLLWLSEIRGGNIPLPWIYDALFKGISSTQGVKICLLVYKNQEYWPKFKSLSCFQRTGGYFHFHCSLSCCHPILILISWVAFWGTHWNSKEGTISKNFTPATSASMSSLHQQKLTFGFNQFYVRICYNNWFLTY